MAEGNVGNCVQLQERLKHELRKQTSASISLFFCIGRANLMGI